MNPESRILNSDAKIPFYSRIILDQFKTGARFWTPAPVKNPFKIVVDTCIPALALFEVHIACIND